MQSVFKSTAAGLALVLFLPLQGADAGTSEEEAFYAWYTASEENAMYYHIYAEFGNGYLGDQAWKIAKCESGLNPRARSSTNDHGLFQINYVHRSSFENVTGHTWSPNVYHASLNAKYARDLYNRQGWNPWACRKVL